MEIFGSCPLFVKGTQSVAIANHISSLQCQDLIEGLMLNVNITSICPVFRSELENNAD